VLGVRDYVRKNGFETVVLGLSGGIDSSLTACVAVDALGQDHVVGIIMPSRFSSQDTQDDARTLAKALGIRDETISIEPCFSAYLQTLKGLLANHERNVTEQNLQARIRGTLLMALSNTFGWLVLTTGNKSEMATGYCTLYGDMAGGFAIIKDVPKTLVYRLARFRNSRGPGRPIQERVLKRPPTAELAPGQRDTDSLPPYALLDPILKAYVEEDKSFRAIVAHSRFDSRTVKRVIQMVDRTEYKRRQGPPGIKITPKAFGKDRRMPITNRYREP
jgi:NAD+ synthase (glutamine-hydrolysing)